jgi:phenylalanyl-tRNA synthetase beta chain
MPVVTLYYKDLENLTGAKKEKILERLPMLGADVERVEKDHIDVEFFPDRPDLFSVEGVARAMRGFLNIEVGLKEYPVKQSNVVMKVERSVKPVRPFFVGAVVKNVRFDNFSIESLMQLQEHLHWTIGRNRRKVSIGVHDFGRVKPPFRYLAVEPSYKFVPLDYSEKMSMEDILKKHPKGVAFAYILESFKKYPLIVDSADNAVSFPPIINAELTRVTEGTRDIFIDVTGTDKNVSIALNIVATALAERGGEIESITVVDGKKKTKMPQLKPVARQLSVEETQKLLGLQLSAKECVLHLRRMRFEAVVRGGKINVGVPAYRVDIMHSWDLIEDIAKGYGYDRLVPKFPKSLTMGETHPVQDRKVLVREMMIGLGFFEVITFTLTNEKKNFDMMLTPRGSATKIKNPISEDQTILRTSLLPNLLGILSVNKHRELPQRLFEVGEVVINAKDTLMLAAVSIHARASFAEIRSLIDAVLAELSMKAEITESAHPSFLKGRRADITQGKNKVGVFGEINPEVLANFGLEHPAVGMEIGL